MKKIFGLAIVATLLAPMACNKQAEEVPAEAPATEEVAPVTDDAAAPAEAAPADHQSH
ncbi:MAG TPA: hypothetical protein VM901_09900 [Bdellovibrionota bacterium]|jgi:hypothetical protein|nr:hypothetical protein [Bdellovibrionota bacterium]